MSQEIQQDGLAGQFTPLSAPRVVRLGQEAPPGHLFATEMAARGVTLQNVATAAELRAALSPSACQAVLLCPAEGIPAKELGDLIGLAASEGSPAGGRRFVAVATLSGRPPTKAAALQAVDLWLPIDRIADAVGPIEAAVASARLAEAMQEIERLRAAVLYARETAHDIAQPLTTILARAQLLAMSAKPEEKHHRGATIIAQEADRMASIAERFYRLKEMVLPPK